MQYILFRHNSTELVYFEEILIENDGPEKGKEGYSFPKFLFGGSFHSWLCSAPQIVKCYMVRFNVSLIHHANTLTRVCAAFSPQRDNLSL